MFALMTKKRNFTQLQRNISAPASLKTTPLTDSFNLSFLYLITTWLRPLKMPDNWQEIETEYNSAVRFAVDNYDRLSYFGSVRNRPNRDYDSHPSLYRPLPTPLKKKTVCRDSAKTQESNTNEIRLIGVCLLIFSLISTNDPDLDPGQQ